MQEMLSLEDWEDRYDPIQDENGEVWYETYKSDSYERDFDALMNEASRLAGGEKDAYKYIWTRIDGSEDDNMYLVNGIRFVNRLDYCITNKPWADSDSSGGDMLIEVLYYEPDFD